MERVELYSYVPPLGENIPVTITPSDVDNLVPKEDEIAEAVKKLRRNRLGRPSGMRAEYLKGWLASSNRGKLAEDKGEEKTDAEEKGLRRPLELRLSGSRWSGLNYTAKYHPRGRTSRLPLHRQM